jgi:hypothetical protein
VPAQGTQFDLLPELLSAVSRKIQAPNNKISIKKLENFSSSNSGIFFPSSSEQLYCPLQQ